MRRVHQDQGMTLIELLVAMTVLAVGISALVAGFSSGILAVNRGTQTSVAGAFADKQMEAYRQTSFDSLTATTTTMVGSGGVVYWLQATITQTCVIGSLTGGACPGPPASRPVKLVSIIVRSGSSAGKLLFHEQSTFEASTA
jgi:prepilin-type N-terminal cleavage/methylation domain-containing protein